MKKFFPTFHLIILSTTILLLFGGLVFLFNFINKKNESVSAKETQWKTENNKREEIKNLNRSVKLIEPERLELESHFAFSSNVVPFLDTVEGLAKKINITAEVTSVDLSKDQNSLIVGLKASGGFTGIYKFITLLENSPYEIEFVSSQMSKDESSDSTTKTNSWSAVFKIKLLSFVK